MSLEASDLGSDPIAAFRRWLDEFAATGPAEPMAMVLATADAAAVPSARSVLLKAVDARGFTFYSNRGSRKGRDLAANPRASLVFPWVTVRRQVVVAGPVEVVDDLESDAYFATRARGSQVGAWASRQTEVIASRAILEQRVTDVEERFAGAAVPRPPFWGGYRVVPETIEFWQGRDDRLHDRLRFSRASGSWSMDRLSP